MVMGGELMTPQQLADYQQQMSSMQQQHQAALMQHQVGAGSGLGLGLGSGLGWKGMPLRAQDSFGERSEPQQRSR